MKESVDLIQSIYDELMNFEVILSYYSKNRGKRSVDRIRSMSSKSLVNNIVLAKNHVV